MQITNEMIAKGYEKGIIAITENMCGCEGVCCAIGGNAFYFDCHADGMTSEEYRAVHSSEEIVKKIFGALDDESFKEWFPDEYDYYYFVLTEALGKEVAA